MDSEEVQEATGRTGEQGVQTRGEDQINLGNMSQPNCITPFPAAATTAARTSVSG